MANTSAAKKALRVSRKKEANNKARKNRIRSFQRKVEENIKSANEADARASFKNLEKEIMRGVTKKVLKLNSAARKLKRLASSIRKISKTSKSAA
jgi:small subunit ribosomal protein S20